jgi:ParB-like chromosome segregation protein Spo0J
MAEIRKIKLSDIKPNDKNPRYINDKDFKDLVESIKRLKTQWQFITKQ